MKKKKSIISIVVILLLIVAGVSYKVYKNKTEFKGTALEPIYKLVKIQHFDQGTYSEYTTLFTDPKGVLKESQFESYRKSHTSKDLFKYDSDTIQGIMKHMKVEKEKDNLYKIYYLKNINDEKEKKASSYWLVTNKDNKWLIKNGI